MADKQVVEAITTTAAHYPWDTLAPSWVYLISILAGGVGFLEEINPADTWKTKTLKGITRVCSSALAAILTFQVLHALNIPEAWHIPITGIGAHMGTEALKLLGKIWKQKLGISDTNADEKKE